MIISHKWTLAAAGSVAVGIVAVTLIAQPSGSLAARPSAALSSGAVVLRPQLTRLQVDLFELRCGPEELMRLDLMELGHTDAGPMRAPPEQILERLRQLGEARLAVRYDNFVDITSGTRLSSGLSVPTVSDIATTGTGVIVPSVSYDRLGIMVDVKGSWLEDSEPNLAYIDFSLESSDLAPEKYDVGSLGKDTKLNLPAFQRFQSSQRVVARQSLPVLLACNDLSKRAQAGDRVPVLIARIVATRLIE